MAEAEKRVTWAELFFDLVFVFAITQVSALLHEDHSWAGVGRALIAFVPPYWAWVGMSLHANRQDVDNPVDRIGIFAVGLSALFMGLALPLAYDGRGVLYGASYWAARLVLWALVLRWQDVRFSAFAVGACLTGPMLLAGGFLDGPARTALWGSAALIDLSMPFLLRRRLSRARFDAAHLPERFGLFVIVALGESVVAIGAPAAASHLDAAELTAVTAAFTLTAGLWWVYFAFAAGAIQHALATSDRHIDTIREVLSYAHLGFIGGVIAVAVGMKDAVAHPTDRLGTGVAGLLFGGCALFLAVFGYTRWRMFRLWSTTRLAASAVVLAVLPLAARLPAVGALGLLALLIAALNVIEWERVRRAASR